MRLLALTFLLSLTACAPGAQVADLSTPAGFLEAFQMAAADSDADALRALVDDGSDSFYGYYVDNVLAGGEWHGNVMSRTVEDMMWGPDDYWISLWQYSDEYDDEGESNVSCKVEPVEGEYRIVQCVEAG